MSCWIAEICSRDGSASGGEGGVAPPRGLVALDEGEDLRGVQEIHLGLRGNVDDGRQLDLLRCAGAQGPRPAGWGMLLERPTHQEAACPAQTNARRYL